MWDPGEFGKPRLDIGGGAVNIVNGFFCDVNSINETNLLPMTSGNP